MSAEPVKETYTKTNKVGETPVEIKAGPTCGYWTIKEKSMVPQSTTSKVKETAVEIKDSPFAKYTRACWAMRLISDYQGIQGDDHRKWLIDQVARVLLGAPIINFRCATWENSTEKEWRYEVGTSTAYEEWVRRMEEGDAYDPGICP